ncbi:GGDEF domain-containing protein [Candidatus Woesearchaeota archaeon]|nr:GGDEF domain-containing protein [Candidatus Woesearchaeota archaeon]
MKTARAKERSGRDHNIMHIGRSLGLTEVVVKTLKEIGKGNFYVQTYRTIPEALPHLNEHWDILLVDVESPNRPDAPPKENLEELALLSKEKTGVDLKVLVYDPGTKNPLINARTIDDAFKQGEHLGEIQKPMTPVGYERFKRVLVPNLQARDSLFDGMTQLYNNRAFMQFLGNGYRAVERSHADGTLDAISVVFIDLDNFKDANSALGHPGADLVLKEIAMHLRAGLRGADKSNGNMGADLAARYGGDEYALLMRGPHTHEQILAATDRIFEAFSHLDLGMITTEGKISRPIGYSIGVDTFPDNGDLKSPEQLLKSADGLSAMAKEYRTDKDMKQSGHSIYCRLGGRPQLYVRSVSSQRVGAFI